jgi:16S rRNA (uracil1498-N3)-methyltransferase
MATPRFYSPVPLAALQTIELAPELAHHAIRVLRLKADTEIILFDGRGGEYPARLLIDGKSGYAQTGAHRPVEVELEGNITLAQGIPAGDKMDWVVEKAVELGVKRLIPITAERGVSQLNAERGMKRRLRWERIAQTASEQCGRNRLMQIDAPQSLQNCMDDITRDAQTLLFCHPEANKTLAQALQPGMASLTLLVGPEGGWSAAEQALALRHGLQAVKFGNRVLRTETAGLALIAACSALQHWH